MVRFRCLKRGFCCKRYWIPVTHLDLLRLEIYGGIPVDVNIIELRDREIYEVRSGLYPVIVLHKREYYLSLRSREDNSCIFLSSDGKCLVHEFKPLVCRFYPFVYVVRDGGEIDIELNENALGECPGIVLDDKPIPSDIVENLKRIARARVEELRLWEECVAEWNREYGSEDVDISTFIDFIMDRARRDMMKLQSAGLWIK